MAVLLLATASFAASGCDDAAVTGGRGGAPGSGGAGGTGAGGGGGTSPAACAPGADPTGPGLGIEAHPGEGAAHSGECDALTFGSNPPSSGNHYPVWPAYRTYTTPVPWGFLVHGLEHGAVVIVYNCADGCPAEVAAAQAWIDALPADGPGSGCQGARPRVVLAPDPNLTIPWAATAWGWTLRSCAFDPVMFRTFFDAHYNQAPEVICAAGADRSAGGWCP